jgi:hypothetical protein
MSSSNPRALTLGAPLLVGLLALVAVACAPPPAPYSGSIFNPPSRAYLGKHYTPTATATSGLPVSLALDPSSTGCSFVGGVLTFDALGKCVINADQPGDATHAAARLQRTISVYDCPPLRPGIWTGPLGLSASVGVFGSSFSGTIDLSSMGYGVQVFAGSTSCEVVHMTFNSTPLTGVLSYDGSTLSSNYSGIDIVLNAPAA